MKVVVVGAWTRSESQDLKLVNQLLDELGAKYPQLTIITRGVDKGVGKIVQNRCMPKARGDKVGEFSYVELSLKIFLDEPTRADLAAIWTASNTFLVNYGEEFHLFCDRSSAGVMQDLLNRVIAVGRPCAVYYSGVDLKPKMVTA